MKRILAFLLFLAAGSSVASAQTKGPATVTLGPATTATGALSWAAPPNCSSGCTYQVYVQTASACPNPVLGSTGWAALGSPTSALTFADAAEAGGSTEIYVVETLQAGEVSAPSNCVAVAYPLAPAAPVLTGTS